MPNKLAGIIGCLIVAALVNVGLRQGIPDFEVGDLIDGKVEFDGSTLVCSHVYANYDLPGYLLEGMKPSNNDLSQITAGYYDYLKHGRRSWLAWRNYYDQRYGEAIAHSGPPSPQWTAQVLRVQDRSAPAKWIALLSLIAALLVLWSKRLKEFHLLTPIFYLAVATAALWTYGALSAPLFLTVALLGILAYAFSIRMMLPLYRTEWVRSLRPLLTFWLVLLGAIAFRGPEWVDYQFWTSDWFRLILIATAVFSLFFHWAIFSKAMANAKLDSTARIFAYAMPLGSTATAIGLFLGFWGQGEQHALVQLNRELLLLPPQWLGELNPNLPFWLLFAGVSLLIIGGIGYLIQRIAR
ncbi:MAG: hypothetical protein AAF433_10735 [Bacteroidota bacterium]